MRTWYHELDPEIPIHEFEEDDKVIPERLGPHNLAFAVYGIDVPAMIFIDGRIRNEDWFTEDHLNAIVAHELGHIHYRSVDEVVAETHGMKLLAEAGFKTAWTLLSDRGIVQT
jgi:hypothetical protein